MWAMGTGWLIRNDLVMTVGHKITNSNNQFTGRGRAAAIGRWDGGYMVITKLFVFHRTPRPYYLQFVAVLGS